MTDTDIANLITELSTSDLFPQFATPTKMMLAKWETNVQTPESISVAEKFYQLAKDVSIDDAADAMAKLLGSVEPKQGQSLWVTVLSVPKLINLAQKFKGNSLPVRKFLISLRRAHGMKEKYNTLIMPEAEYEVQFKFKAPKNWTRLDYDNHDAELLAKYPF